MMRTNGLTDGRIRTDGRTFDRFYKSSREMRRMIRKRHEYTYMLISSELYVERSAIEITFRLSVCNARDL